MDQSMMAAARLRAMAEKATRRNWRVEKLRDCVNEGYYAVRDGCEFGQPFIAHFGRDNDDAHNADLIVHLRNRAQLYADLIEAAAGIDHDDRCDAVLKKPCTCGVGRVLAALAAIDVMESP